MNGTIGGDLSLHTPHEHQSHQSYSVHQDPGVLYHVINSSTSLTAGGVSMPHGSAHPPSTTSLGQYVTSSVQNNNLGYNNYKFNSGIVQPDQLPVRSPVTHPPLPLPLPAATHPPLPLPAATHPLSLPTATHPLSLPTATHPLSLPTATHPPLSSAPSSTPSSALINISENATPPVQSSAALLTQMNQLGPSERCTPSQAQSMGQQLLNIIAQHERSKLPLPNEVLNSFDVFHRCLAVVYGTFFLNLYTKANAPCLLCHGCKSLYPPGQFIHHACPTLPPNILPCRSRMWRRCLVPLVSQGMDKLQQKQRWKYILEKFSHTTAAVAGRRNPIPPEIEAQLLEMPELKRGRFIETPTTTKQKQSSEVGGVEEERVMSKLTPIGDFIIKSEEGCVVSRGGGGGEEKDGGNRGYQNIRSMEEEEQIKDSNYSPEGTQNLLDIEPPEYELEDGASPNDPNDLQRTTSEGESRGHTPIVPHPLGVSVLGLADQLVTEVKKLQQEVALCHGKLKTATEIIEKMPSETCMREQLAQAIATQQSLTVERDQAREQLKLSQERGERLQKQLDSLRQAYGNMEKLFIT